MMPKITFLSHNISTELETGSDLSNLHGKFPEIPLKFGCRQGECGTCAIKIAQGHHFLTKRCPQEIKTLKNKGLDDNYRLACQCALNGDIVIS